MALRGITGLQDWTCGPSWDHGFVVLDTWPFVGSRVCRTGHVALRGTRICRTGHMARSFEQENAFLLLGQGSRNSIFWLLTILK